MKRVLIVGFVLAAAAWAQAARPNSCADCHSVLEGNMAAPAAIYAEDIHQRAGFTCVDCHGGDPTEMDPERSMSAARGFLGKIRRTAVPRLCARCHSDATLIHKYSPRQRVDQLAQYLTSVHGQRLTAGDEDVANCVDCHSVHDIREVKSALSPVHPLKLPGTCARCHADAKHMARYKIPTTQHADYLTSVHWNAVSERQDLSAPSCASCHGNHGATPPQVTSVAAVCGTCHALMQDLYQNSPHRPVFQEMGFAGCVACHENHAIRPPTPEMLAGDNAICSQCHDSESAGGKVAAQMYTGIQGLRTALDRSREILDRARVAGMEVSEALLQLQEAEGMLVKARVAVHSFRAEPVEEAVAEGMTGAQQTYSAGEEALREWEFRRKGLAASLGAILLTIAGLWLMIRRIEAGRAGVSAGGG